MTGDCAKELIAEFDTASSLRADIAKPAWHNSLRIPKGEELTNEQWKLIADDYMDQRGSVTLIFVVMFYMMTV